MKIRTLAMVAAAQLALLPQSQAQDETTTASHLAPSSFWEAPVMSVHRRHLEGIGLVLWGMDNLIGKPRDSDSKVDSGLLFRPLLKGAGGIDEITRGVGVLRLQDGLDVTIAEPQAATYQWIDDANIGNFWNLDAAAILDVYLPTQGLLFPYDPKNYGFHLRAGASWERSTLQDSEVDQREFFLGASFQPGNFESLGRAQTTDLQIGFLYQEDAILDAHQWTLSLNIQPTFPLLPDGKFVIGQKVTFKELLGQIQANAVAAAAPTAGQTPQEKTDDDFLFIRPNISFDSLLDDFSQDGNVDFSDYNVTFGGRLGFSMFKQHLVASYKLAGVSPIDDIGDTHVFHEARLEYQPFRDWSLRFTAAYQYGERAPDFQEEDRVVLSAGLRF